MPDRDRWKVEYQLSQKGKISEAKIPKTLQERFDDLPTPAAIVLAVVAATGVVALAAIAPGVLKGIGSLMRLQKNLNYKNNAAERKLVQTVYYLKRTGKIDLDLKDGTLFLKIKKLGKIDSQRLAAPLRIKRPDKWDGKYWLVAADIPTKEFRGAADAFRKKMQSLHFYPLQRTLWLHPYDPREVLQRLLEQYSLQKFVTLMCVETLDRSDKDLALQFWRHARIM